MNRCADALKEYAKKLPDSTPKQARRSAYLAPA
jgi:hypothetical protein